MINRNFISMKNLKYLIFVIVCMLSTTDALAQESRISGVVKDNMGPVMSANVVERDANNRIISATTTDFNGNFSMVVKNRKDKLTVSFVGYKTLSMPIGARTSFVIQMEDATMIHEVTVTSKRKMNTGGLAIPKDQVSVATQTLSMKDLEGLAITSADEALQGKIAGLDIVANSGNLGSGTTMRLRGVTTINGNSNPLIVVDDNIFDNPDASFDFQNATEESYAALLSVNPQDIESIDVLKDAAATAIWGSRGANGVISIKTKRGARGAMRVDYSLRLQVGWQPKGYDLLNGDDFTMLLKEEKYNPLQTPTATTNINEINYNKSWADFENWNNNTDWVKSVEQTAISQYHYLSLSGGGEKANYRISLGYDHQQGTIIKQTLDRFSTKLVLDYFVSDRIKFSTTFPLTYTNNHQNYDDHILSRAQKLAPNMSIYRQDASGEDTGEYYIMLPQGQSGAGSTVSETSSSDLSAIRDLGNPVAIANLAWRNDVTYRITPEFKIDYNLLGLNDQDTKLKYTGSFYLDYFSENKPSYWPQSLSTNTWANNSNTYKQYDYNNIGFTTRHQLTFTPHFRNEDFYSTMMARWELTSVNWNNQMVTSNRLANGVNSSITNGNLVAGDNSTYTGNGQARSVAALFQGHLSYKERYSLDASIRADGSSRFGDSNKFGYFPGVALRWNVNKEHFMKSTESWLSMLGLRFSYGVNGRQPDAEYLQYSKFSTSGNYGLSSNTDESMSSEGLKLANLKWETTTQYNVGANFGFLNDMFTGSLEFYLKKTKDLLIASVNVPYTTGYSSLSWSNVGDMKNRGWELNLDANKFIKIGNFSVSANFNIAQNINEITSIDESVLENINAEWTPSGNGKYLNRIQVGNAIGSIYGLKYKGVYQYSYDYLMDLQKKNGWSAGEFEQQINKFLAEGHTAPVAVDASGNVMMQNGSPVRKVYYFNDGQPLYKFNGGDAIYEDVNHDGQINSLDVMYLGNSNPKFTGGFGFDFNYGNWSLKTSFNFRTGCKIVNLARMNLEKMYDSYNQSYAVNWRWRNEGDVTEIPRAMYGTAYNWIGSDRYVEDGSFVRFNYLQLGYKFNQKLVSRLGLNRLQLSVSGQNLFVWSKYSGTDPEVSPSSSSWGIAYDNSQTPRSKSITMNMIIGF